MLKTCFNMLKQYLQSLTQLIYPNVCIICAESLVVSEQCICHTCLAGMPRTNYHLQADNEMERRFWAKVSVERATAFYFFSKGSPYQQLLHELKYKNNQRIAEVLGRYAAIDLTASEHFNTIDTIVPVPLHPKKLALRGYNQSECIAKGLAQVLGAPIDTQNLVRTKQNTTQTRKSVYERFSNTEGIFSVVESNAFANKHLLVVDDVMTTGSTLEACIQALLTCEGTKVSVFTLALA